MKAEIEQVVSCDETARREVDRACKEAEALSAKAAQEAEAEREATRARLEEAREGDLSRIVLETEEKARQSVAQAEAYAEALKGRAEGRRVELSRRFVAEVLAGYGPGRPDEAGGGKA